MFNSLDEMLQAAITGKAKIEAGPPSRQIYAFFGMCYFTPMTVGSVPKVERMSVSTENTMWMNCVLSSPSDVFGLVLYTGIETRVKLNTRGMPNKFGRFDHTLNNATKFLFLLMLGSAVLLEWGNGWGASCDGPYCTTRDVFLYLVLTSFICSISLRTVLEVCKVYMASECPTHMPGCVIRNTMIPEELGSLQYLFTDKTGTLTKNEMKLM